MRLFNAGDTADTVLVHPRDAGTRVVVGDARTVGGKAVSGSLILPPKAFVSIRIGLDGVEDQ